MDPKFFAWSHTTRTNHIYIKLHFLREAIIFSINSLSLFHKHALLYFLWDTQKTFRNVKTGNRRWHVHFYSCTQAWHLITTRIPLDISNHSHTHTHTHYCVWKKYHQNNSSRHLRHPCLWASGWKSSQRGHCVSPAHIPALKKEATLRYGLVFVPTAYAPDKNIPVRLTSLSYKRELIVWMHFNEVWTWMHECWKFSAFMAHQKKSTRYI